MTNNREQGVFSFDIKHPYKVSIDGTFEDRNGIICHEFDSKATANTAADMEQMLLTAFSTITNKADSRTKKQIQKEEKEENDFYENNSPSDEDIKKRADELSLMFKMQRDVKMSELIDMFEDFIAGKLIRTDGDKIMYGNTWDGVHKDDRIDIMFRYIIFFVNPLRSLSQTDTADSEGK